MIMNIFFKDEVYKISACMVDPLEGNQIILSDRSISKYHFAVYYKVCLKWFEYT